LKAYKKQKGDYMQDIRESLINKLELFFRKELSLKELMSWSDKKSWTILDRTKPMLLEDFVFSIFLDYIADDTPGKMCTEDDIKECYEVLIGNKNTKYNAFIKNPCFTKKEEIEKIEKSLRHYAKCERFLDEYWDLDAREDAMDFEKDAKSIEDILYFGLLNIMDFLPINHESENNEEYEDYELNGYPKVEVMIDKINTIIRYIKGEESFYLTVFFEAGNYKVLFM